MFAKLSGNLMLNLKLLHRLDRIMILALLAFTLGTIASHARALAQDSGDAVPSTATVATDPARDAAMKDYLQKRFKIPSASLINMGPAIATPIAGLFARQLSVANAQGQTINTTLFFDKKEDKAIIGQYLNLGTEPWGRVNMSAVSLDDHATLGPANAPVTIVEFADFECPFCAHAFSVIETLANTTYKGKVRVIFKNYPLNVHPWAIKAAEAGECARLQNPDAFFAFARYFYSNQGSINIKNLQEHIDKVAKAEKLDAPSLKACMDSPQTEARIKLDQADGNSIHVNSTPTFFVNGIPVVGLPDGKVLEFVISAELDGKATASAH